MGQKPASFARPEPPPQPRVPVGSARGVGGGFNGAAAISAGMDNDFKAGGWMYHPKDVGPEPDIRSPAPPARRAGKLQFA